MSNQPTTAQKTMLLSVYEHALDNPTVDLPISNDIFNGPGKSSTMDTLRFKRDLMKSYRKDGNSQTYITLTDAGWLLAGELHSQQYYSKQ